MSHFTWFNEARLSGHSLHTPKHGRVGVAVNQRKPPSGLENTVGFFEGSSHHLFIGFPRFALILVFDDFLLYRGELAQPSLPHNVEFTIVYVRAIRRVIEGVVNRVIRDRI